MLGLVQFFPCAIRILDTNTNTKLQRHRVKKMYFVQRTIIKANKFVCEDPGGDTKEIVGVSNIS